MSGPLRLNIHPCLSSDSTALTVSVSSTDPDYLGAGSVAVDYITMSRASASDPFSGSDAGYLMGSAEPASCTNDLLTLPAIHDRRLVALVQPLLMKSKKTASSIEEIGREPSRPVFFAIASSEEKCQGHLPALR